MTGVADILWSVHVNSCLQKKKTMNKRPMTGIKPDEQQHRGCDQSSTKTVTSTPSRFPSVAKQHKASTESILNLKTRQCLD